MKEPSNDQFIFSQLSVAQGILGFIKSGVHECELFNNREMGEKLILICSMLDSVESDMRREFKKSQEEQKSACC